MVIYMELSAISSEVSLSPKFLKKLGGSFADTQAANISVSVLS